MRSGDRPGLQSLLLTQACNVLKDIGVQRGRHSGASGSVGPVLCNRNATEPRGLLMEDQDKETRIRDATSEGAVRSFSFYESGSAICNMT